MELLFRPRALVCCPEAVGPRLSPGHHPARIKRHGTEDLGGCLAMVDRTRPPWVYNGADPGDRNGKTDGCVLAIVTMLGEGEAMKSTSSWSVLGRLSPRILAGALLVVSLIAVHSAAIAQGVKSSSDHWVGAWATAGLARLQTPQRQGRQGQAPQGQAPQAQAEQAPQVAMIHS